MAHVVIRTGVEDPHAGRFEVDGVDLSQHVARWPLRVEHQEDGPPLVHATLFAHELDMTHGEEGDEGGAFADFIAETNHAIRDLQDAVKRIHEDISAVGKASVNQAVRRSRRKS